MKKYEVIYHKFKDDILTGRLKKKDRIPSIRQACDIFKVSQTTIEHAYSLLEMDGYIESVYKTGFVVALSNQRVLQHQKIEQIEVEHAPEAYRYDLRTSLVSYDSFEITLWKRYLKELVCDPSIMSSYGDNQGEFSLRQALSQYVYRNRGIFCRPENIWIGSNYQGLLFAFCGMLPKHVRVGMEIENNDQALRVFQSYGFEIVEVDYEDLSNVDVLYLNTACMTKDRRPITKQEQMHILEQADCYNILILEDDYNGELTYRSKSRHSLFSASTKDRVIYCGSFSRLVLPSVRISYLILNAEYTQFYQSHQREYGPMASKLEQLALSRYIVDGGLEKHLRKLKREYRQKSLYIEKILKIWEVSYQFVEAYTCFILDWKADASVIEKCKQADIGLSVNKEENIVLSFASISKDDVEQAMNLIKSIIFPSQM